MVRILDCLLANLPSGWHTTSLYLGVNWTLVVVQNRAGQQRAGLAATPASEQVALQTQFRLGPNPVTKVEAAALAQSAQAADPVEAAVGLATLNALLQPEPEMLADIDAADWLVVHGRGRKVALVGRFPFINELKPVVGHLWVLELSPQPGEYRADQASEIIPQADVVAITSSSLINHTLDGLLALTHPEAKVMLLGPSTPLTPLLFDFGVHLLAGVQVIEVEAVLAAVATPANFQKMTGVRRVSMQNLRKEPES